jgi:hypothetical protein
VEIDELLGDLRGLILTWKEEIKTQN